MNSIGICVTCFLDPFLGGLPDSIVDFPWCILGLSPSGYLLDLSHNDIHYMCLATIICRALCGVMPRLVTIKARYRRRVAGFPLLELRCLILSRIFFSGQHDARVCMGSIFPRLRVCGRSLRIGTGRISASIIHGSSIIPQASGDCQSCH